MERIQKMELFSAKKSFSVALAWVKTVQFSQMCAQTLSPSLKPSLNL